MQNQKKIIVFIGLVTAIYLSWYFLFEFWILPHTRLHDYFTIASTVPAAGLLNHLDILPVYWSINPENQNVILHHSLNGMRVVNVGHGCNSLSLMVLFSGFILAFPGAIKSKVLFIPVGILIIYGINILRIVGLAWTWYYHHTWTDFNHKYLFTAFMYAAIFGLWLLWVRYRGVTGQLSGDAPE